MSATDLAVWCLITGQSPEVWRSLTRLEREEFFRAGKKFHRIK